MKIFFTIKSLDQAYGGAERVLTQIAGHMAAAGHDITVLSLDHPGGKSFFPLSKKVHRITLSIREPDRKLRLLETLTKMKEIRREVLMKKPDVVIAFMHSMYVPVAFALAGTGIPVFGSEHVVPNHYKKRPFEFFLVKQTARFLHSLSVVSEGVKAHYPVALQKKMITLPNPVKLADRTFTKAELNNKASREGRKTLLTVGRLEEEKDQECLIRAFGALAPLYPEWDLRIIGEGRLRARLEKLIQSMKLTDRIFMPGTTHNIEEEYKNADIFVLPSLYESFGLVTVEAMSHGVPAIGFVNCPGTNEIIIDGTNGLLVPGEMNRIGHLKQAMVQLMDDPAARVRMGLAAIDTTKAYSPENVYQQWDLTVQEYAKPT